MCRDPVKKATSVRNTLLSVEPFQMNGLKHCPRLSQIAGDLVSGKMVSKERVKHARATSVKCSLLGFELFRRAGLKRCPQFSQISVGLKFGEMVCWEPVDLDPAEANDLQVVVARAESLDCS